MVSVPGTEGSLLVIVGPLAVSGRGLAVQEDYTSRVVRGSRSEPRPQPDLPTSLEEGALERESTLVTAGSHRSAHRTKPQEKVCFPGAGVNLLAGGARGPARGALPVWDPQTLPYVSSLGWS